MVSPREPEHPVRFLYRRLRPIEQIASEEATTRCGPPHGKGRVPLVTSQPPPSTRQKASLAKIQVAASLRTHSTRCEDAQALLVDPEGGLVA